MTSFVANGFRFTFRRGGLPALLALLLFGDACSGQEPWHLPKKTAVVHDQTRVFRRSLFLLKFEPLHSFEDLREHQENCILVLLGKTHPLMDLPGGLREFLSKGGAALIASDEPMMPGAKKELAAATGVSITGLVWEKPLRLQDCYREKEFCPWMVWDDRHFVRFMRRPGNGETLRVATNMPSSLQDEGLTWRLVSPFALLPPESPFWRPHENGAHRSLLGVAGPSGEGHVIVLADHSIFIDEMMRPTDNDNVEFAANCMTYLRGENNQRTKVLFVEDGKINPSFNVPTKRLPAPPLSTIAKTAWDHRDEILDVGNRKLHNAQARLNELDKSEALGHKAWSFLAQRWNITPRSPLLPATILATLGLLIYGCYRLGIVGRHRVDANVPPLPQVTREQQPHRSLIEMRHDGVLEAQNIWEAGRQLARDAFEAGGVVAPTPYREPNITVKGPWWRRLPMRQRVRRLWRLAFLNQPVALSPLVVFSLAGELEELKSALQRGIIQVS